MDCNFRLSNEGYMPKEVFTVLRKGLLVDMMRARAEARGQQPIPTYQAGTGARTRMHGILTNPNVAALVQEEPVVPEPALPGHDLLSVGIALDMACQQVTITRKIEDPPNCSLLPHEQSDRANIFSSCLHRPPPYAQRTEMPHGARGAGWQKSSCNLIYRMMAVRRRHREPNGQGPRCSARPTSKWRGGGAVPHGR